MNVGIGTGVLCLIAAAASATERDSSFDANTYLFPPVGSGERSRAATWREVPSWRDVRRALPSSVTIQGRTRWRCHVRRTGRLNDCTMRDAWPRDDRYERAGRKLLRRFILSSADAAEAQRMNAVVSFEMDFVGRGLKQPDAGTCPMPFCHAVSLPPPPPLPKG